MVAEEALEFGLLDKIVKSRMELNEILKSLS
jgi:ATP-dependent protease ClpP protease subunit